MPHPGRASPVGKSDTDPGFIMGLQRAKHDDDFWRYGEPFSNHANETRIFSPTVWRK